MIPNTMSASTPATTRTIIDDVSGIDVLLSVNFAFQAHRNVLGPSTPYPGRIIPAVPRKLYDLPYSPINHNRVYYSGYAGMASS
jgi:hypothetical protein